MTGSQAITTQAITTQAITTQAITTLLVANRGEIARRVFRTAGEMGMRCVAVYVDADATAPFVQDADIAVRVPSYLDGDAIIEAARRVGVDAIHPGYGFLSENSEFARAVSDSGIVWVGPSPEVIAAMGDKIEAKKRAVAAGVPTLPSSNDPTDGEAVGYPLLVKASAGGGGKGMRVVEKPADLAESVAAAQREALNGFGDDTVFLERFVGTARHIEVQILGDQHGAVVHYGERECSIQRRHQKVVEESPSPAISADLRAAMGGAAVDLGSALGYSSAGTVEFLLDDGTNEFFFLEVNTRLQVEHPVTEMVRSVDLVRQQLLIAMGHPLDPRDGHDEPVGHAIEVRLYAEDPTTDFLPANGTLHAFEPHPDPAIRWDSGVETGSVVGVSFDPMLAKVIAHASTRTEAAGALARALETLHLGGVVTNRDFLVNVLRHPAFIAGDTTTDFIDRVQPARGRVLPSDERERVAAVAALWLRGRHREQDQLWGALPAGWRNARLPMTSATFIIGGNETTVSYRSSRDGSLKFEGGARAIVHEWTPQWIDIEIDGIRTTSAVTATDDHLYIQTPDTTVDVQLVAKFVAPGNDGPTGGFVAPMPGVVLDVRVTAGDTVTKDQVLVILEAMKMEHHMRADENGVVAEVFVTTGQQVENGAVLLVMQQADEQKDQGVPA